MFSSFKAKFSGFRTIRIRLVTTAFPELMMYMTSPGSPYAVVLCVSVSGLYICMVYYSSILPVYR